MATYQVTIVNEHFSDTGEHEAADDRSAWKTAMASAIAIAGDQVAHGNPFFGAEVTLEEGDRKVGRYVVAVGATPLID
jgi:hypothetical protein